jgi:hypothetical protein
LPPATQAEPSTSSRRARFTVSDGVEVARLQAGALFGESGVLEARPRAATATAITRTNLLVTDAETFIQAFGMNNERALMLVKMLCQRLRSTNLRTAELSHLTTPATTHATIRLLADEPRLATEFGMPTPIEIHHLPFQVGNRYGGETIPIASNHSCCIAARGHPEFGAPHFEILRRDGRIGVHDLGTPTGTIVNGMVLTHRSLNVFTPLHQGDNTIIAGHPGSLFRFRLNCLK